MVQYYWNPNQQQQQQQQPSFQNPSFQNPYIQQPMPMPIPMPPPVTTPSGRSAFPPGEQSYIENILRLNIGNPGIFHFSFANTLGEVMNTRNITGTVEAAGRDHVIVRETATGKQFLFPMIYFDYAEFEGEVEYFPQTIQSREL